MLLAHCMTWVGRPCLMAPGLHGKSPVTLPTCSSGGHHLGSYEISQDFGTALWGLMRLGEIQGRPVQCIEQQNGKQSSSKKHAECWFNSWPAPLAALLVLVSGLCASISDCFCGTPTTEKRWRNTTLHPHQREPVKPH